MLVTEKGFGSPVKLGLRQLGLRELLESVPVERRFLLEYQAELVLDGQEIDAVHLTATRMTTVEKLN